MLDIFALLVMLLLAAVAIWLVVFLGSLPGKIARVLQQVAERHLNSINLERARKLAET